MFEHDYLRELGKELFARGVWGRHARSLSEQLEDHLRETAKALREEGMDEAAARKRALEMTGPPGAVARSAAEELRRQCALGRHPWLLGGAGVFVALIVIFVATVVLEWFVEIAAFVAAANAMKADPRMMQVIGTRSEQGFAMMACLFLMNWGPWLLGLAFLGWMAWRVPAGWKALMIASVAVGLAGSAFTSAVQVSHGSGCFMVTGQTWAGLLLWAFLGKHAGNPNLWDLLNVVPWMKLILPVAACMAARRALPRWNFAENAK